MTSYSGVSESVFHQNAFGFFLYGLKRLCFLISWYKNSLFFFLANTALLPKIFARIFTFNSKKKAKVIKSNAHIKVKKQKIDCILKLFLVILSLLQNLMNNCKTLKRRHEVTLIYITHTIPPTGPSTLTTISHSGRCYSEVHTGWFCHFWIK